MELKIVNLELFLKHDIQLTIVDLNYEFANEVLSGKYNGIFISNGPGDPKHSVNVINQLKFVFEKNQEIPIFGICYGHQLIGLANNFNVNKMKYGNRGHNIPCNLVGTEKCYITSQNHGYEVILDKDNQNDWKELFVNCNDNSNEGLIHKKNQFFQFNFIQKLELDQLIQHFYLIFLLIGVKMNLIFMIGFTVIVEVHTKKVYNM